MPRGKQKVRVEDEKTVSEYYGPAFGFIGMNNEKAMIRYGSETEPIERWIGGQERGRPTKQRILKRRKLFFIQTRMIMRLLMDVMTCAEHHWTYGRALKGKNNPIQPLGDQTEQEAAFVSTIGG
jgi:hypothetical protein